MSIKGNYTVVKSNLLNEMKNSRISENEYKLFCIYLSRINPKDPETSCVTFTLQDYGEIMQIKRPRREELQRHAESLIGKTITIDNDNGGFSTYALFILFELSNKDGEWVITVDSNPGLAPYLFKFRNKFFKYKLYNTIYLDSYNQMRIYEILKQFEKIGERTIELGDLRKFLGVKETEYPVWGIFARDVIKKAQKVITERTDISFDFEPIKKVVNGKRRVTAVKFKINKNCGYIDQLCIESFLNKDVVAAENITDDGLFEDDSFIKRWEEEYPIEDNNILSFYSDACENEFNRSEIQVLYDLLIKVISINGEDTDRYDYLRRKYHEMEMRRPEKNRFGYLKKLIEADIVASDGEK